MRFSLRRKAPVCDERLRHIAFIMDGNRRWARRRALPVSAGHAKGADTFKKTVRRLKDAGLQVMTVYAFSTENWKRSDEEISAIMDLLARYMDEAEDLSRKEDARVNFIGDLERLRPDLRDRARALAAESRDRRSFTLQIALSYGGREEIVHAINALAAEGKSPVTEDDVSSRLYTAGVPDPDLVVRTGGEIRTSNFLMWQSAYAEYIFLDTLWPDLSRRRLYRVIREFYRRRRRYGA